MAKSKSKEPDFGQMEAILVRIERSDGQFYTTETVKKGSGRGPRTKTTTIRGEPIPESIIWEDTDKACAKMTDAERTKFENEKDQMSKFKLYLGTHCANELGWDKGTEEHPKQYIIQFPEGYQLRLVEYANDVKEGHLYGHPNGFVDKWVYRSPRDFGPHVIWLLSDSENRSDCLCKACHAATGRTYKAVPRPEAEKKDAPPSTGPLVPKKTKASSIAGSATSSKQTPPTTSVPVPVAKPSKRVAAVPTASKSGTKLMVPIQKVSAPAPAASAGPSSQQLPTHLDTDFRVGEMVWFQQVRAWRIGIIHIIHKNASGPIYNIAPLGYSALNLPNVDKAPAELRPFLTFSVPSVSLPQLRGKMFHEIDWVALARAAVDPKQQELVGLEASKAAAIQIDSSWSTTKFTAVQAESTYYGGVFLGAEQIRMHDPIRPKDKSMAVVLEVKAIVVQNNELFFHGDEWYPQPVPIGDSVTVQPQGEIFVKDAAFRSELAALHGQKCVWVQRKQNVVWAEATVAGRSYVTSELMNLTDPEGTKIANARKEGKPIEQSTFLNNRMQNVTSRNMGRQPNRSATIGASVSAPLVFEGMVED